MSKKPTPLLTTVAHDIAIPFLDGVAFTIRAGSDITAMIEGCSTFAGVSQSLGILVGKGDDMPPFQDCGHAIELMQGLSYHLTQIVAAEMTKTAREVQA